MNVSFALFCILNSLCPAKDYKGYVIINFVKLENLN